MKKLINILLLLCIALGMTACQQKTIVATINYKNGEKESGMSAELKENSTVTTKTAIGRSYSTALHQMMSSLRRC